MKKTLLAAVAAAALAPLAAHATLGYFAHGYGIKAKGMGGVGIALPQDASSGITNPANLGFVGNRLDLEIDWFRPIRNGEITGNLAGLNGSYDANGRKNFLIPGVSYNRMLRPDLALGLLVYGNGGMNTTFRTNPFGAFGGSRPGGVDYMQLFIAPTLAWKPNANHSLGVSLNIVHHQFAAQGLEPFAAMSASPANLTNRGRDSSNGAGLRLGWTGRITPSVMLGAMYQPRTDMGRLNDYQGLFRNGGDLDIPATYGVGISVQATPRLTLGADLQRIDYAKVAAIGTPSDCATAAAPTCQFGAGNGPGFGWRNMTALKLGASYAISGDWTLRAGLATGRQPIPASQSFLNIIFPAVVENHFTLGATWNRGAMDVSLGYLHAFSKKLNGEPIGGFGGGSANLKMHQDSLGVALGWKM